MTLPPVLECKSCRPTTDDLLLTNLRRQGVTLGTLANLALERRLHETVSRAFLVHHGTNQMSSSNGFATFAVTITLRGRESLATVAPHSFAIAVFTGILTLNFFICCDRKPPGRVRSADISAIVAYVQPLTLWRFAEDLVLCF